MSDLAPLIETAELARLSPETTSRRLVKQRRAKFADMFDPDLVFALLDRLRRAEARADNSD